MPFYSEEVIDQVRQANDIVDVVSQYVHLKKSGSTYMGLCPFHSEKTPSFSVSGHKQIYYCFGCNRGGDVIRFVQNIDNLSFGEAVKNLADRAHISLPEYHQSKASKERADKRQKLLDIQKQAATYYYSVLRSERGKRAYEYFKGRGLSDETMKNFALGYSESSGKNVYAYLKKNGFSDDILRESGLVTFDEARGASDKFWNRAMFPIMDANNHVIAFGGRVMGDGKPKYLNSPETPIFDKSRTLYGLHLAKHTRRGAFILCEGYMDVIALHQAGFDNAVASLGTALTPGHASLIKRYVSEVFLCYDSDQAGINAALRAIPILREAGIECRVINMSPYKDPDEFMKGDGPEEYENRIKEARNAFLFTIDMLEREYDLEDPTEKTAFQRAIAVRLLAFSEKIERENYLDAIIEKYHYRKDGMEELIRIEASKPQSGALRGQISSEAALRGDPQYRAEEDRQRSPRGTPYRGGSSLQPDGYELSMMTLLGILADHPDIYPEVREHFSLDDFRPGILRDVAEKIRDALESGSKIRPDLILGSFVEGEDQEVAARVFNSSMDESLEEGEIDRVVTEQLIKIKKDALNNYRNTANLSEPGALDRVNGYKNAIEELQKKLQ
ncbi:MAG: DNA primase [Lachnospiraceae bacterium]|nr:DNA primase [Lachnospiraceae bacterium]